MKGRYGEEALPHMKYALSKRNSTTHRGLTIMKQMIKSTQSHFCPDIFASCHERDAKDSHGLMPGYEIRFFSVLLTDFLLFLQTQEISKVNHVVPRKCEAFSGFAAHHPWQHMHKFQG